MIYWWFDVMSWLYTIAFWYLIAVLAIGAIAVVLGVLTERDERDRR